MRILFPVIFTLFMSGCLATSGNMRTIESTPSGALVTIENYGTCETPCTVKLDGRRNVTIAKAGYKAQRFAIDAKGKPVRVKLELAAPTGDVDAQTLPEID